MNDALKNLTNVIKDSGSKIYQVASGPLEDVKKRANEVAYKKNNRIAKESTFDFKKTDAIGSYGTSLISTDNYNVLMKNAGFVPSNDPDVIYDYDDLDLFYNNFWSSLNNWEKKENSMSTGIIANSVNPYTIKYKNWEFSSDTLNGYKLSAARAADSLITVLDSFKKTNGYLPDEYAEMYNELSKFSDDVIHSFSNNAVIKPKFKSEEDKKNHDYQLSTTLSDYAGTHGKYGVYPYRDRIFLDLGGDTPIKDLTDTQIISLVQNNIFDIDEMFDAGLGHLASYIESRYREYMNHLYSGESEGFQDNIDRFGVFQRRARDSFENALESTAKGVVNTVAAGYNLFAKDDKVDEFIKNNKVTDDYSWKYSGMGEDYAKWADIVGSSLSIAPIAGLNLFVPGSGMALITTSTFGNTYSDNLSAGVQKGKAAFNALLHAGAEFVIEKYIAGGIPGFGSGSIGKYAEATARVFNNSTAQRFVRVLFEAGGEGVEEVLSYYISPLIDYTMKMPGAKLDYKLNEAFESWAGGFIGSFVLQSGSVIMGADNSRSAEAFKDAQDSINDFKKQALHYGINDTKTKKALDRAQKAIKNAGYYNADGKFVIPKDVAELINVTESVNKNPDSVESQELIEKYAGVGETKLIRNDYVNQLIKDKKISRREVAAMDTLAYDLGVNIEFTDNIASGDGDLDIVTRPDGKKFVKASRQVIKGNDPNQWAQDVMDYINNSIRHGRDVVFTGLDGEKLTITRDTAGKARYRNEIQEKGGIKREQTDKEYGLKLRISTHIDEISQVSKGNNKPLEPDRKNHPFAKDGFEYRSAFFEDFDGSYYYVRFSVGHNGEINTVYNVGRIEKRNGTPGRGSKAKQFNTAPVTHSSEKSLSQQFGLVNGEYSADGRTIRVNINGTDPFFQTVLHESVHAIARSNKTAADNLAGILNILAISDPNTFGNLYNDIVQRYQVQFNGDTLHDSDLIKSEYTARLLSTMLDNPQTVKALAQKNMNAFQRLKDNVLGFFDSSIERYKSKDFGDNTAYAVAAEKLEQYRGYFQKMFEGELEGYYSYGDSSVTVIRYSNSESSSIKNQIRSSLDELNNMAPVCNIEFDGIKGKSDKQFIEEIFNYYKKRGFEIDRQNFGTILLDKKSLNRGLDYLHSDAEFAAFYSLYDVLKKGKDISGHTNHKNRGFPTRTIAAPVTINGKSGITAVVVKMTNGNKYKMHRVLAPDGTEFIFEQKNKPEATTDWMTDVSTGESQPITSDSTYSLPRNHDFDNTNINENDGAELGSFDNENNVFPADQNGSVVIDNGSNVVESDDNVIGNDSSVIENLNTTARRIFTNGRVQYGLEPDVVYDETVSFTQADIDQRLGRQFTIPDENTLKTQTDIKDSRNNSLHFSDNVVFSVGDGADIKYGTGRILGFEMRTGESTAVITVDSGDFNTSQIEVPAGDVTFVSHNNNDTISSEFKTSNHMYERAKSVYDEFVRTNDARVLERFSFNDCQNYILGASERMTYLRNKIKGSADGYDEGIVTAHNFSKNSDGFDFDAYSQYELGLQYYEAVRNYNLAKKLSDVYISNGAEFVDMNEMIKSVKDIDHMLPGKGRKNVITHGNYMFNDVYRNFERFFGSYYDVVKPTLDNFDRAKGNYARNIISKAEDIALLCKKYDFKPGSEFDAAIQMLGEGRATFDLSNKKHRELFKKMGLSEDYIVNGKAEFDFDFALCSQIFGAEKAAQIQECANCFKGMYDEYLQRANEVIARIYPGQSERLIHPRKDYFRHFGEISETLGGFAQVMANDIQIDPMLVGKTDRTKPNRSWESPFQERKTNKTDYSAVKGFIDYIQHAEYTININPFIKEFRELGQFLAEGKAQKGLTDANSFINYLDKFTNHLAKKTIGLDRIFTDILGRNGRTVLNGLAWANNRVMKNSILGNFSVSVKQILNLKNGLLYLQKPSLLVNSTMGLLKAYTEDGSLADYYESLFKESNYLTERFLDVNFAEKKSGARKVAEKMASIGDEFGVRAIWLAAYEDGVKLGAPDPVIYADDIARKCSAGRGIGEQPLIFTQQTSKLVLPFLLENNNNWNVYRDMFGNSAKSKKGDSHRFADKNSYLYYKNQNSTGKRIASNSFKAALFLLASAGIDELIEELTGYQPEFNIVNDFAKGYKKAIKDNGEFDLGTFFDGLGNSLKNTAVDAAEHRNFSWVYSTMMSYFSDDPLSSNNDFFGSMPVFSSFTNIFKDLGDGDHLGAVLDGVTSFGMPFGGSQLKKTINGGVDYLQGGNYANNPTKQLQNYLGRKMPQNVSEFFGWDGPVKGGEVYDVKQTPENALRGFAFGQSAFPEAQEYYAGNAESKSDDSGVINSYVRSLSSGEYKQFVDLYDETGKEAAIPYKYIPTEFEYAESGQTKTITLDDNARARFQKIMDDTAKAEYLKVSQSKEYKNADADDKVTMLSYALTRAYNAVEKDIVSEYKAEILTSDYISKFGEDEVYKAYKASGKNADYLPFYEVNSSHSYTLNGEERNFTLSDEELSKYNDYATGRLHDEYMKIVTDPLWYTKSTDDRINSLSKVRDKVSSEVNNCIKNDHIYAEAMITYDAAHGEDNPVKKAYDYSHDASVYPYWEIDSTITFTYKKQDYSYELSTAPNSFGDRVEYDVLAEAYVSALETAYNNAMSNGDLNGKSPEEIYNILIDLKNTTETHTNKQLRNYAKAKLGLPESSFQ